MFEGRDLLLLSEPEMRKIRGDAISMIFQEPMTSLNPVLTIGHQIAEVLVLHRGLSREDAMLRAVEMLRLVRIPEPERRVAQYPHQLSGGMRQRVMIAMALACEPRLLIADEPTTALDVTIQAQILDLMRELKERTGAAIVLITHDLGVVAEMAQRVVVMYAGRKVEEAPVDRLVRPSPPSVHARAARFHSEARRREHARRGDAACRNRRHGALARRADRRLRLCAALRLCHDALPERISAARGKGARSSRRLLGIGANARRGGGMSARSAERGRGGAAVHERRCSR